jgi:hypothetical protein
MLNLRRSIVSRKQSRKRKVLEMLTVFHPHIEPHLDIEPPRDLENHRYRTLTVPQFNRFLAQLAALMLGTYRINI